MKSTVWSQFWNETSWKKETIGTILQFVVLILYYISPDIILMSLLTTKLNPHLKFCSSSNRKNIIFGNTHNLRACVHREIFFLSKFHNTQNNDMSNRVLAHVPVFIVTGTSLLLPNNAIFSISLILILGVKIHLR